MKRRKLKRFVLPLLYLTFTTSIFLLVIILGSNSDFGEREYKYSTTVLRDNEIPVTNIDETKSTDITSPVDSNEANIAVHYYDSKGTEEEQKSSIIYYENTYLPNTGILYTSDKEFTVKTVFEGKVKEINDNEFFGKVLVVEHTNSLKTYYYGLNDIEVSLGDEITSGTVLGIAKNNEIMNNKKSFLLEVYHNNELLNPEKIIGTKITDY